MDADQVLARIQTARDKALERQQDSFRQADEAVRAGDTTKALARTTEASISRAIVRALDDILEE